MSKLRVELLSGSSPRTSQRWREPSKLPLKAAKDKSKEWSMDQTYKGPNNFMATCKLHQTTKDKRLCAKLIHWFPEPHFPLSIHHQEANWRCFGHYILTQCHFTKKLTGDWNPAPGRYTPHRRRAIPRPCWNLDVCWILGSKMLKVKYLN